MRQIDRKSACHLAPSTSGCLKGFRGRDIGRFYREDNELDSLASGSDVNGPLLFGTKRHEEWSNKRWKGWDSLDVKEYRGEDLF